MTPAVTVYDDRPCLLGEGAFWHPVRGQFFWFDILSGLLMSRDETGARQWDFGECVSACGWVDEDRLLIASETALSIFDIGTGRSELLVALESGDPTTRSNDGRADPAGGFWIGTMGKKAERHKGAIYRFFEGRVEKLYPDITIPNAICFTPAGDTAYFTDTVDGVIKRVALDGSGWPKGEAEPFLDLKSEGLNPDGAVVDAEGFLWNAQWGAARVARYGPDGRLDRVVDVPSIHASCPAFGGEDLSRLFVTSALSELPGPGPADGLVHVIETGITGQAEPRVRI
jgi:sugar lactone lactonase YvrE